jgi:hypothetical protein
MIFIDFSYRSVIIYLLLNELEYRISKPIVLPEINS